MRALRRLSYWVGWDQSGRASHRPQIFGILLFISRIALQSVAVLGALSWGAALAAEWAIPIECAPAYDRAWQITTFEEAARVSQQRAFDITFETNGVVWLATSDGLRRYDGYVWEQFTNTGLPSAFIRCLALTKSGELWVGTDAGVGTFDYKSRKYTPRASPQLPTNCTVRHIAEDPDGTLWFCTDRWPDPSINSAGLVSFRQGQWRAYRAADGLADDYILNYFRDSTGRQYAMTLFGTAIRNGERWELLGEQFPGAQARLLMMAEDKRGDLFFQREGDLWLLSKGKWKNLGADSVVIGGTHDGNTVSLFRDLAQTSFQFCMWDGNSFARRSSAISCRPGARIYKVVEAPDGAIWCIGQNTVMRWGNNSGQWQYLPKLPPPGLCDPKGRVWFVSESNVVFYQGGQFWRIPVLKDLYTVDSHDRAWGPGGADGAIRTVSLVDGEMKVINCGMSKITHHLEDTNGMLWTAGIDDNGVPAISHREAKGWRCITDPYLLKKTSHGMFPDGKGGFWYVTQLQGSVDYDLAHVTENSIEPQEMLPRRPPIMYPNFAEAAGYQWLAGYAALYRRSVNSNYWEEMKPFADSRLSEMVLAGDEVFFTLGGKEGELPGCAMLRDGTWQTETGVFITGYRGRDEKTMFFTSRGGVYVRRQPGTLVLDYIALPSDVFCSRVVEDAEHALWINTAEGVLRYRPGKIPPKTTVTTPLMEPPVNGTLYVSFGAIKRFEKPHPPTAFRYSWRFDKTPWSPFCKWPGRSLPLGELGVGEHQLEVRACDADGNVDAQAARVRFHVVAVPLQEQPWFGPLVTVVIALLGYLVWLGFKRTREIHKANAALRGEVVMRSQTEAKLEQAREGLERRVAERTLELSMANQSLSREISERKQAEEMRAKLEDELRHAQKMEAIGTMAGGIAHDFNNLLAAIIPYTHLALEETQDKPEVQKDLNQVLIAAERARLLVQQVLTFSGQQRRERKTVDLAPVLEDAVRFLRSVLPSNVKIETSISPGLCRVLADVGQINQVLVNLGNNAAQAIQKASGSLRIGLDQVEVDSAFAGRVSGIQPGKYLRLSVEDTGCGMKEEVKARVFDPFFTTRGSNLRPGMGLPVVYGIVTEHGGHITVDSHPGKGTRFEIFLPAQTNEQQGTLTASLLPKGNGERILLVDDEPALCSVLGQVLKHLGYRVSAFGDPAAALKQFRLAPQDYDLVLTDLTMPGMSGIELAKRIQSIRRGVPVVLTTGYERISDREDASSAGVVNVISKPIDPITLRQAIYQALGGGQSK